MHKRNRLLILVIKQFSEYFTTYSLLPDKQSSYRKFHSTDTALLRVHNDILAKMDKKEVTVLILFYLSSAFDTIDHEIMLDFLECDLGVIGPVRG